MLTTTSQYVTVCAQCPACIGLGYIYLGEQRPVCRGCFGFGVIDLLVSEETEDTIWDEAMTILEMAGVSKDPDSYTYQWRDGQWLVVDSHGF